MQRAAIAGPIPPPRNAHNKHVISSLHIYNRQVWEGAAHMCPGITLMIQNFSKILIEEIFL